MAGMLSLSVPFEGQNQLPCIPGLSPTLWPKSPAGSNEVSL